MIWKNPDWTRTQQSVNQLFTEVPDLVKDKPVVAPSVKVTDDDRLTPDEIKLYIEELASIKRDALDAYHYSSNPSHKDRLEYARKLQDMITTGRRAH